MIQHLIQDIGGIITLRLVLLNNSCFTIGNCDVFDPYGDEPTVSNLYITEPYRGEGYGGQMLDFAEAFVRSRNRAMYLFVTLGNPAIAIYKKRRYVFTGEQAENGDLRMIKNLRIE